MWYVYIYDNEDTLFCWNTFKDEGNAMSFADALKDYKTQVQYEE